MVLKIDNKEVAIGESVKIGDATLTSLPLNRGASINWERVNGGNDEPYTLRKGDNMKYMAEDGSWSDSLSTLIHALDFSKRKTFILEAD